MNDKDLKIIEAMETYGGSFVAALAKAAREADHINLAKLKATWSNYWAEYAEMAGVDPRPDAEINREQVDSIKRELHDGEITYEEALAKIAPVIKRINARGEEIAKGMGVKHKPVTAREILR